MTPETIGHETGCSLAKALRAIGEKPLMKVKFKSDAQFEPCISDEGFWGTRPKTADGCPRWRAAAENLQMALDAGVFAAMSERSNVRAKLAPTVWRAGRLAQNGPQALRRTASVTRRWCSA